MYLIWQQFESEIEESGIGAGWKITNNEPSGMRWYFSEGTVAIQGKLRVNSKMDDLVDVEAPIIVEEPIIVPLLQKRNEQGRLN